MGRSFESVRMGVRDLAVRWERAARRLPEPDRIYAARLVEMAKRHSSEAFYAFDDPLEAAFFSIAIELLKEEERAGVDH
ncbi:MAG: hypothetical protein APR55_07220 [Methanolinea sp. SDB]|nr:MAG: hypothetical protein APR55_07220 [Methanolinea sp. SDB]